METQDRMPRCIACGTALSQRGDAGFLLDHLSGGYAAVDWVQGPAEWSFWSGTRVKGRERRKVEAMRCPSCGRIELYAWDRSG